MYSDAWLRFATFLAGLALGVMLCGTGHALALESDRTISAEDVPSSWTYPLPRPSKYLLILLHTCMLPDGRVGCLPPKER